MVFRRRKPSHFGNESHVEKDMGDEDIHGDDLDDDHGDRPSLLEEALQEYPPARPAAPEKPRGYLVLGRGGAVLLGLGILFVLVWVFVLGVLVGRGTIFQNSAFQQLETSITGDTQPGPAPTVEVTGSGQSPSGQTGSSTTAPPLTFYNDLESDQPPSHAAPTTTTTLQAAAPTTIQAAQPAATTTTMAAAPTTTVRTEPALSIGPTETTPTTAGSSPPVTSGVQTVDSTASAAPPPVRRPGENFTVQVAAAGSVGEADKIVEELRSEGFDAYFYQVELHGRTYFRVRVGRYATRDEAQTTYNQLAAKGHVNMFISELVD